MLIHLDTRTHAVLKSDMKEIGYTAVTKERRNKKITNTNHSALASFSIPVLWD